MNRVQITQALVMPSIDLSSAFVYVLVIGGGGYMVLSPDFDVDGAGIITFLLGMVMVFDPARLLAQFFGTVQSNLVLLDRIRNLYRETPTIKDTEGAKTAFDTSADITLNNVQFAYDPEHPLFDGLDMTFGMMCRAARSISARHPYASCRSPLCAGPFRWWRRIS
jgi:ABC-type multidrug transport system fused ATPase/permease subunit